MFSRREVCKSLAMMPFLGIPSLTSKSLVETKPDLYSDVPNDIIITEYYTNTSARTINFLNTRIKNETLISLSISKNNHIIDIKNDINCIIKRHISDAKCKYLYVTFNRDGRIIVFTTTDSEYEILDEEILEKKVIISRNKDFINCASFTSNGYKISNITIDKNQVVTYTLIKGKNAF